ncbi:MULTISPECIES: AAA family ATPase [Micrococcaceae]|uniref:AAA family ATPase n=2 Tax=Actinomycetes TaxID=1760 RepID=UPI001060176B|nr:AAA family ATPase [Arthrobacter sp. JUb115]TDU20285.1 ATPase family protein associated with various cellular activities (AAA) [Arthrobacter sp. JUb115]
MNDALIASLLRAVEAAPDDHALRLHLAEQLDGAGRSAEALSHVSIVLQQDPGNASALGRLGTISASMAAAMAPQAPVEPAADAAPAGNQQNDTPPGYDWEAGSKELGSSLPAPFIEGRVPLRSDAGSDAPEAPIENPAGKGVTLDDVGGLQAVKDRLDESFLAPMRNAAIAKAFGKSLRGGLLLYGPPGCGKTFLARAVAGELKANFMSVTITDVVDSYIGETEKRLKAIFDQARKNAPTVLFIDEIDAIGIRRGSLTGSGAWMRQMVNQLLIEMDSLAGNNDGLYVLGATNHPWDLDEALLRPGRLDRTLLVTPPDAPARESILRYHLKNRPIAGIDLEWIAAQTDGFSGADLEHVCTTAAEKAMMQSIERNEVLPLDMGHIRTALAEIKASTLPWLESARNVVRFSNQHGRYDDLSEYLVSQNML